MSLLGRFLGGARSKAYADGVALIEAGNYAEAVDCLRVAALGKSDTPSGSLAGFQFRQALLREGRRLLRTKDKARAIPYFSEAVKLWDQYPDLHCLLGATQGLTGDWETALLESRLALALNPDYAEARLLEAVALQRLGRRRQAAESLNGLVASGQRVEHWLISGMSGKGTFGEDNLPDDLVQLLERSLSGQSEKEEVASAVALCRAGNWDEGLARFANLVERRPRYPDYRTRHAAALFQTGRNAEALAEAEAALALNEGYRMAVDLKALILADSGQLLAASRYLAAADESLQEAKPGSPHEAMFGAYLRAVLALMTGRASLVRDVLGEWPELPRTFARAELLLAAADHLTGDTAACGRRLNGLVAEWSAEPLYFFLLGCYHLAAGRWQEAVGVLGRWPAAAGEKDRRPLYLEGLVALGQGRVPSIPEESAREGGFIDPAAWALLGARSDYLQGAAARCWQKCEDLIQDGLVTEQLVRLQAQAAVTAAADLTAEWQPRAVVPDSCLGAVVHVAINRGQDEAAVARMATVRRIHPEFLLGTWLDAEFWLAPVRGWIA